MYISIIYLPTFSLHLRYLLTAQTPLRTYVHTLIVCLTHVVPTPPHTTICYLVNITNLWFYVFTQYLLSHRHRSTTRSTSCVWWHTVTRTFSGSFRFTIHSFTHRSPSRYSLGHDYMCTLPVFAALGFHTSFIHNTSCYLFLHHYRFTSLPQSSPTDSIISAWLLIVVCTFPPCTIYWSTPHSPTSPSLYNNKYIYTIFLLLYHKILI